MSDKKRCLCGQEGCFGHEVINEVVDSSIPGFTSKLAAERCPNQVILFEVPFNQIWDEPKAELTDEQWAAHPGPFLVRWLPRESPALQAEPANPACQAR